MLPLGTSNTTFLHFGVRKLSSKTFWAMLLGNCQPSETRGSSSESRWLWKVGTTNVFQILKKLCFAISMGKCQSNIGLQYCSKSCPCIVTLRARTSIRFQRVRQACQQDSSCHGMHMDAILLVAKMLKITPFENIPLTIPLNSPVQFHSHKSKSSDYVSVPCWRTPVTASKLCNTFLAHQILSLAPHLTNFNVIALPLLP